jgi:hypothetical protein
LIGRGYEGTFWGDVMFCILTGVWITVYALVKTYPTVTLKIHAMKTHFTEADNRNDHFPTYSVKEITGTLVAFPSLQLITN